MVFFYIINNNFTNINFKINPFRVHGVFSCVLCGLKMDQSRQYKKIWNFRISRNKISIRTKKTSPILNGFLIRIYRSSIGLISIFNSTISRAGRNGYNNRMCSGITRGSSTSTIPLLWYNSMVGRNVSCSNLYLSIQSWSAG